MSRSAFCHFRTALLRLGLGHRAWKSLVGLLGLLPLGLGHGGRRNCVADVDIVLGLLPGLGPRLAGRVVWLWGNGLELHFDVFRFPRGYFEFLRARLIAFGRDSQREHFVVGQVGAEPTAVVLFVERRRILLEQFSGFRGERRRDGGVVYRVTVVAHHADPHCLLPADACPHPT